MKQLRKSKSRAHDYGFSSLVMGPSLSSASAAAASAISLHTPTSATTVATERKKSRRGVSRDSDNSSNKSNNEKKSKPRRKKRGNDSESEDENDDKDGHEHTADGKGEEENEEFMVLRHLPPPGKRKANMMSEILSVPDQVKNTKEMLVKNKKKTLADLRQRLKIIDRELKKDFSRDQINQLIELKEIRQQLHADIHHVESDQVIRDFDDHVASTIDLESFQKTSTIDQIISQDEVVEDDNSRLISSITAKDAAKAVDALEQGKSISSILTGGVAGDKTIGGGNGNNKTGSVDIIEEERDYVQFDSTHLLDDAATTSDLITLPATSLSGTTISAHPISHVIRDVDEETESSVATAAAAASIRRLFKPERQLFVPKHKLTLRKIVDLHERIVDHSRITPRPVVDRDVCANPKCRKPLIHSGETAVISCTGCGLFTPDINTSNNTAQSYYHSNKSAPSSGKSYYTQFDATLSSFDRQNYKKIPVEVFDEIKKEVQMTDGQVSHISSLRIKEILRKKGMRDYYTKVVQIYSQLNGREVPTMTKEIKTSFQQAFKKLKIPYEKHKGNRKNFLSYPLVFIKLCRYLGYEQFIPFLNVIKDTPSLRVQEKIWENMCIYELGWEYESE